MGSPTYSSRWKPVTRFQAILGSAARAASISNCEAPVATMMFASPRAAIASRISVAPAAAAALPICGLSDIIEMCISESLFYSQSPLAMHTPHGYVDLQVNGYADID